MSENYADDYKKYHVIITTKGGGLMAYTRVARHGSVSILIEEIKNYGAEWEALNKTFHVPYHEIARIEVRPIKS